DTLGADSEALALVPRLPPAAQQKPVVRALLALAAARTGDRAAALAWLSGPPASEDTAAVFIALGHHAVLSGDATQAQRALDEARLRNPADPALPGLVAALSAMLAPLEEQAERALAEGRAAEAYALAVELLSRFPDSKIGQRIARRWKEEQRLEQATR